MTGFQWESLEVGAANSLGVALVRVQMGPNEKTNGAYMGTESETIPKICLPVLFESVAGISMTNLPSTLTDAGNALSFS